MDLHYSNFNQCCNYKLKKVLFSQQNLLVGRACYEMEEKFQYGIWNFIVKIKDVPKPQFCRSFGFEKRFIVVIL